MITDTKHSPVQTNVNNQQEMAINITPAAFNALLEKLYNDPLPSTIRELTTNAIEAQMLSKTNKKILFQIPSSLDPNMIIRDFGIGLDDTEINKYLNCLFSTTKSGDNEFPGGYGMGAKSPLALVDSFNLTSYKNGIAYHCIWFKKNGTLPVLTILSQEKTKEENGLKINIPLASKFKTDFRTTFIKAVRQQLMLFSDRIDFVKALETNPVNINQEIFPPEELPMFKGVLGTDKVALLKNQNTGYSYAGNTHYVSVGDVIYPVPSSIYSTYRDDLPSWRLGSSSSSLTMIVDVPIGALDIAPNRESIMVTDENKKIVTAIFDRVKNALVVAANRPLLDFKSSKDINSLKTADDLIIKQFGELLLPARCNSLGDRNSFIYDTTDIADFIKNNSNQSMFGYVGYGRKRLKFGNYLNKSRVQDAKVILLCNPADVNKARYAFYSSEVKDLLAFNSCHVSEKKVVEIIKEYNETYGLISGQTLTLATDTEVTAEYTAHKALVKTTRSANATANTSFASYFGGIFFADIYYSSGYKVFRPRNEVKIAKQYDSNGKEIPFNSFYLDGKKNVFVISTDKDELPADIPITSSDISNEFKDFKVVTVQSRYYDRVLAAIQADKSVNVYHENNRYVFKTLDITNPKVYSSNDYLKSVVTSYLREQIHQRLVSSNVWSEEGKREVVKKLLKDLIIQRLTSTSNIQVQDALTVLTTVLNTATPPITTSQLYPVEVYQPIKDWIDKGLDLIPEDVVKAGDWKSFAKSALDGDIYSQEVTNAIIKHCDFSYTEYS